MASTQILHVLSCSNLLSGRMNKILKRKLLVSDLLSSLRMCDLSVVCPLLGIV